MVDCLRNLTAVMVFNKVYFRSQKLRVQDHLSLVLSEYQTSLSHIPVKCSTQLRLMVMGRERKKQESPQNK